MSHPKQAPPGLGPVRDAHKLPEAKLLAHLVQAGLTKSSKISVLQFNNGQSNPTYLLSLPDDNTKLVLRKKPPGKLLKSAHQVEREYFVMKALGTVGFPVPKMLHLCEDDSVIGTAFYVMSYVEGRVFDDNSLKELKRPERYAVYAEAAKVLAWLHSIDFKKIGLESLGKSNKYYSRQLNRWVGQYQASKTSEIPAMEKLIDFLKKNDNEEVEADRLSSICHGDFRLGNLMFHPTEPRVVAVLDWELCTIGHPYADLTFFCGSYYMPKGSFIKGLLGVDLVRMGIPSQISFLHAYFKNSLNYGVLNIVNSHTGDGEWSHRYRLYMALSFFRLAAIAQGVYKRAMQGNASSPTAVAVGKQAKMVAEAGWGVASSPDPPQFNSKEYARMPAALSPFAKSLSPKFAKYRSQLLRFMDEYIYPNEVLYKIQHDSFKPDRWKIPPVAELLKKKAKKAGLWNLFIPDNKFGAGLTNLEYAPLCEIMGRSLFFGPEVFNCAAPDTGNMEVLIKYGSEEQKKKWLIPLLNGEIRSCFAMTEPQVASSDASNIESSIVKDGDEYVINGRKVWISGALDPRCEIAIFMGKTSSTGPKYKQQSMILIPLKSPGFNIKRPMSVFGYDDAPHGHAEISIENVRVPASNMLLGEGRGFEIAQGRLGPGRIHHCMRCIGVAERALESLIKRASVRKAFGSYNIEKDTVQESIARCRLDIEQARLLTLQAASMMDVVGNKVARLQIAMIKVLAPNAALDVLDRAIQVHGAAGIGQDFDLAMLWAQVRTLRFADGPDAVHLRTIAQQEIARARF